MVVRFPDHSPFIDLMFVAGTAHYLIDRYFHPETASAANFDKLLVYFLTFLVIDFVASTLAFAAAGSLLGYSFFAPKERRSVSGQVCLGVLVLCAGVVTWQKRQEEAEAARRLVHHVKGARDARWLRKNPVAYA